ncbi:hypothetical protein [Xylocopilactobacillus apicola]|nr:hypothetical protein [Xylocopilactobacillus apicola]
MLNYLTDKQLEDIQGGSGLNLLASSKNQSWSGLWWWKWFK